jgi:hypothetical protein
MNARPGESGNDTSDGKPKRRVLVPVLIVGAILVIGILFLLHVKGKKNPAPQGGAAVSVVVKTVAIHNMPLWTQFSARMKAVNCGCAGKLVGVD